MQVEFRSHFSGKKVRLMGQEIWYMGLVLSGKFVVVVVVVVVCFVLWPIQRQTQLIRRVGKQ